MKDSTATDAALLFSVLLLGACIGGSIALSCTRHPPAPVVVETVEVPSQTCAAVQQLVDQNTALADIIMREHAMQLGILEWVGIAHTYRVDDNERFELDVARERVRARFAFENPYVELELGTRMAEDE